MTDKKTPNLRDYIASWNAMEHTPRYARVVCADGATVSIQAGRGMYSEPRDTAPAYSRVEAGMPSVVPPASWHSYAEDEDDLTHTVYGYLPWTCVDEFIAAHGGMVGGALPPRTEEERQS